MSFARKIRLRTLAALPQHTIDPLTGRIVSTGASAGPLRPNNLPPEPKDPDPVTCGDLTGKPCMNGTGVYRRGPRMGTVMCSDGPRPLYRWDCVSKCEGVTQEQLNLLRTAALVKDRHAMLLDRFSRCAQEELNKRGVLEVLVGMVVFGKNVLQAVLRGDVEGAFKAMGVDRNTLVGLVNNPNDLQSAINLQNAEKARAVQQAFRAWMKGEDLTKPCQVHLDQAAQALAIAVEAHQKLGLPMEMSSSELSLCMSRCGDCLARAAGSGGGGGGKEEKRSSFLPVVGVAATVGLLWALAR